MKSLLKRLFLFFMLFLFRQEEAYYRAVAKEKYSFEDTKKRIRALSYRRPEKGKPLRILAFYINCNWEDVNLLPGLKSVGEVIQYPTVSASPYSFSWQFYRKWSYNRRFLSDVTSMWNKGEFDVIFFYTSANTLFPSTMKKIMELGIPTINIFLDDYLKFRGYPTLSGWSGLKSLCRYFSVSGTTVTASFHKYLYEGGRPIFLAPAANPDMFSPLERKRDIDVCFIGKKYGKRAEYIEHLAENDVAVETYGLGWDNGTITTQMMIELYSRAKIVVGFSDSVGALPYLTMRDFEVPVMGPLYITEGHDDLRNCFKENEEIAFYADKHDLLKKIQYYLENEDERAKIGEQGRARVLADHTWEKRFHFVFDLLFSD